MTTPIDPIEPVQPSGKDDRIEEAERIRLEAEKRRRVSPEPPQKPLGFAAAVLVLLSQILDFLMRFGRGRSSAGGLPLLRETLLSIKAAFAMMAQEDRSQDGAFLKDLSRLWQTMLKYSADVREASPLKAPLKRFIGAVGAYPQQEQYTFGYYLEEYTGAAWLPIPYIEMLQRLHRSHEARPSSSQLSYWIRELDEILLL